ncbi:hypothetical protein P7F60_28945 [Rhizobium sp. YJ-22]|uniref:hypothetical protein n=1 Tax=Rhizobium sp. YJ-22 TaxID=3037556 RepID=UPI002412A1CA|nr:hypothetical protein [Rhizobium sp. YJ-22]MDG3580411.1 hypothetical protein [Rhizobium sp. YJ-22]
MISSRFCYLAAFVRYCRFSVLITALSVVARYVIHAVATPFVDSWMRPTNFKPVLFRVIQRLRPVYRDSYATHGLSLNAFP